MSKGSIVDCTVRVKPSEQLCSFIASLDGINEMPENVIKIYDAYSKTKRKIQPFNGEFGPEKYSKNELRILEEVSLNMLKSDKCFNDLFNVSENEEDDDDEDNIETVGENFDPLAKRSKTKQKKLKAETKLKEKSKLLLTLNDLRWVSNILGDERSEQKTDKYLHELLVGSKLVLPKNQIIPRNPELEARCQKLRQEQDARVYRNMTKNVDSSRRDLPEDTIAYQVKSINRQLIAVLQFIFSVAAGFAFGFIGVELILGNLDFGFRLLLGIICALVIALAEIYFLAKKLNEYDVIMDEPIPVRNTGKLHKD